MTHLTSKHSHKLSCTIYRRTGTNCQWARVTTGEDLHAMRILQWGLRICKELEKRLYGVIKRLGLAIRVNMDETLGYLLSDWTAWQGIGV